MYTEEKPPLCDYIIELEELKHYGVSGMKRGVRKEEELVTRTNKPAWTTSKHDAVRDARRKKAGWSPQARAAALAARLKNMKNKKMSSLNVNPHKKLTDKQKVQGAQSKNLANKSKSIDLTKKDPKLPATDQEIYDKGLTNNFTDEQRKIYGNRMRARREKNPNDPMVLDYFGDETPSTNIKTKDLQSAKAAAKKNPTDNDILSMLPKDRKKVDPKIMAAFKKRMEARYKKNPKDKQAYEYLFT